jgi:ribonuclease T2
VPGGQTLNGAALPFIARVRGAAIMITAMAALAAAVAPPSASAEDGDTPGQFDFYVLSLSWSPSFCAAAAERNGRRAGGPQCGARPYSFVVHGLWPQYEHGFPEYCETPSPRLNYRIMSSMLDLMPAPRLVYNEWDKHGTCSGMDGRAYFDTIRKARAAITIPDNFTNLQTPLTVSPGSVEDAFIKANPGLTPAAMSVGCDRKRLTEVRICLTKDLKFHDCPEIAKRSCRRDQVVMPPVRGG